MGSSGSKSLSCSPPAKSSSCSERVKRGRSKGRRVFQSSCLGTSSGSNLSDDDDNDCGNENKENEHDYLPANQTAEAIDQKKIELDGWDEAVAAPRPESTSVQSLNPSSSFLSRFSFIPGNISFRLSRATSVGSRSYPVSSTNHSMLNDEDEIDLQTRPARGPGVRDETQQANGTHSQCYRDDPASFMLNTQPSGLSNVLQENQTDSSTHLVASDCDNARLEPDTNFSYPRILSENESSETRQSDRRIGSREPVERNVRFSRTLSVGRLRDRVLRRSSLSDNLTVCPQEEEADIQNAETRALSSEDSAITSPTPSGFPTPSLSSGLFSTQDYEMETSRPREARYHDLLEHRSNFLERRRRIRSQVRALQRLGSRFENLSGHERSCILSGQHRTGHCTCRLNNRDTSLNDNTSARASISRIVMLAEALFEVLDEIHQQSVVLSSHSASSIGSFPAPNDVVDSLPVKLYSKLRKHQNEEVAQCYICLVEYEEGDSMRVLPCHHEFHAACVDKWLKEIHRVCPLCRGDICRPDAESEVK